MAFKFFKGREETRVKRIRGVRARYMDGPGTEEIEIEFISEAGDRLTLRLKPHQAYNLVSDLTNAYEAINPPLNRRNGQYAQWDGME